MAKDGTLELMSGDAELFDSLTDEEAGKLVKQLLHHVRGEDMDFGDNRFLAIASIGIRQRSDEISARRKAVSKERSLAGKAGAKSRAAAQQTATNANKVQQCLTNSTNVENACQNYFNFNKDEQVNENKLKQVSKFQQTATNSTSADFDREKDEKESNKEKEENLEQKKETPIGVKEKKGTLYSQLIPPKKFVPPKLDEVRSYIREKGYSIDADRWWNFYESKGWMIGKNKMRNWHAAVATWKKMDDKKKSYGYDGQADEIHRRLQGDDFTGIDETTI